ILLLVGADAARRVRGVAAPDATDAAVVHAPELAAGSDAAVVGIRFATVVVVVEGAALMTTELAIARLVAPFFGTSQAVWAVIIATVMGSIALGSRIGGRLADRLPTVTGLSVVLVLAAVAVALLPVVAPPVMRPASGGIDEVHVGVVIASFLATMALLVVPITLLGAVPPWLLRLAVPGVGRTGRTAGRLYASSTAGALAGTFGSTLWLVPELGTRRTMLLAAAALALLAAVGLHRAAREPGWVRLAPAAALVLVVVLAILPTGLVKPLGDGRHVLEERESRYQFVQAVEEEDGRRILQLNEGWAVHSLWERGAVLTHNYWDHFAVVPSLTRERARDMLVIGDAGGTTRRLVGRIRPDLRIDAVELDPDVTAVGRRWFDLRGHVVASDGRPFLARTDRHWDAMMIDAYRQPYIPFYLTTREFFETAKRRLRPGGVVSINVGSAPGDRRIDDAIAATMRDVFPTVVRYRAEPYNDVIVAVDDPGVSISQLRRRIDRGVAGLAPVDGVDEGDLDDLFGRFSDRMRAVRPDHDRVLTDDRAPVEWMTDRMIFGAAGD
ncbi:MAG: Spermine synthase, partial [Thermoleophilia bacterium]|nr:Spermine synthase [Thermoleophilia bacterium]